MRSFRRLVEFSFPSGFSLSEFIKLKDTNQMIQYVRDNVGYPLGEGSSRIVFELDSEAVLKIATSNAGIAQNRAENKTPESGGKFKDLFAKVHMVDPKGRWLIMEKVFHILDSSEFKEYFGVDSRGMNIVLKDPHTYKDEDLLKGPMKLLIDYLYFSMGDLVLGDVCKSGAWGLVERNGKEIPVLLDYGFTQYVSKKHY